jgi:hypothetical protein
MNESKKVYAAIHAVAADLSELGIEKGRKNQAQGFVFRGIDDVLQTLSPILKKHKLLMLPTQIERVATAATSSTGKPMNHVSVTMEYKFVSVEDGSEQVIRMPGEGTRAIRRPARRCRWPTSTPVSRPCASRSRAARTPTIALS